MYPDFRYLLGALGIEAPQWLGLFKTFGLLVALAFLAGAWVLTKELKRKEALGWFKPEVGETVVGRPATMQEIFWSALTGFLVGYKVGGLIGAYASIGADPVSYIFSLRGSFAGGLLGAALLGGLRWWEARRKQLPSPEKKRILLWPHQRVGEMVMLAAVTGFVGAKIFNALETWDDFTRAPLESLISGSGFTFYGGLITATAFFVIYIRRRKWDVRLVFDCLAPAMMLAYGLGRLGCQLSGDGDWGIANSAYITEASTGDLRRTEKAAEFVQAANASKENRFFAEREYGRNGLQHAYVPAPSWLPRGLFAMNFPHNVNEQGILLAGCEGREYCAVLPFGVFPTSFYEAVLGIGLFGLLWAYRRKLTRVPLRMTGLYLFLNGFERFFIEKIRVNTEYDWGWLHPSQAEIISTGFMLIGAIVLLSTRGKRPMDAKPVAIPVEP